MDLHEPDKDLQQELEADYRMFDLAGSHHAIGRALGSQTELRKLREWGHRRPSKTFAEGCAAAVSRFHPGIMEEYAGFAAAHRVDPADLLPHVSLNLPYGEAGACSALVCRTSGGNLIAGRNYDFFYRQRMRHIVRLAPPGYYASIGTNSGLVGGRYEGVNEHGLFVSMHSIMANRPPAVRPGIAFHLVVRIALETCSTAKEAVRFLRGAPHIDSFNYTVADPAAMYVVEAYPQLTRVFEGAGYLAVTNHYRDPNLRALQGRRDLSNSLRRLERLEAQATARGPESYSLDWLAAVLCDHGPPLCGHRDGIATLWSSVLDLTDRRVYYSLGAPCRNRYQELLWPGATTASGRDRAVAGTSPAGERG